MLTALQHRNHDAILCSPHIHLEMHNCLEVMGRGLSERVKAIADAPVSTRVRYGALTSSTTGRHVT